MRSLIYVNLIGRNADNEFIYEFYFSDEADLAWGVDWDVKPSSICNLAAPQKMNYDEVKILRTDIILNVASKNSCFSMQDCKDGVISLAWEDIDMYDEYPENGRIVFRFGDTLDDVESKLLTRDLSFDGSGSDFEF